MVDVLDVRQNMITFIHILSPVVTLAFLIAAIIYRRKSKSIHSLILLLNGSILFLSDILMHYLAFGPVSNSGFNDGSSALMLMNINGWIHALSFLAYAITLVWILRADPIKK